MHHIVPCDQGRLILRLYWVDFGGADKDACAGSGRVVQVYALQVASYVLRDEDIQ